MCSFGGKMLAAGCDASILGTSLLPSSSKNKRLRHALAVVKAKPEHKLDVKIMTNREKVSYKKRPRLAYGPDFEVEDRFACQRTQASVNVVTTEVFL
jgi:hypothetical protein